MGRGHLAVAIALALALTARAHARPGRAVRVEHLAATPTLGPASALVTVEVYLVPCSDASHGAYRAVRALAARHPRRVRAIFRLRQVGSCQAIAPLLLAAHDGGQFFPLLDAIAASSPVPGAASVIAMAEELGIDRGTLAGASRDPAIARRLADDDRRAQRAPTGQAIDIVMNGIPVSRGPVRLNPTRFAPEELERAYQVALVDARQAAAQGLDRVALASWQRRRLWCDEPNDDAAVGPGRYRFRWGTLLDAGSDCQTAIPTPGRSDEPIEFGDLIGPAPLATAALSLDGAPGLGPRDAALVVAVICDPNGDACRHQLAALRSLVDRFDGEVRLVWLPWASGYVGDFDPGAARAAVELGAVALCAAELGDGWPFTSAPASLRQQAPSREDLAAAADVDPAAVAACTPTAIGRVQGLITRAATAGVVTGPTVMIAGRLYRGGFIDAAAAAAVIEQALAPGLLGQMVP